MKNLTVKKIEKIKQCLYICLCCFIVLLGASISFTVLIPEIKKDIEYQNSWQARASFDFEKIVEKDESGNDKVVYGISTPEQLAGAFMQNKNVYATTDAEVEEAVKSLSSDSTAVFRLTSNVDMTGHTWQSSEQRKNIGTFDGGSFAISNLKITGSYNGYCGFLTENSGTIQSVYFINITVSSSASNVGAAVGRNFGRVINVHVISGNVTGTSTYSGGIVGYSTGGEIRNCINYATVSSGTNCGGIVGYASSSTTIENNFNYGNISSNKSSTDGVSVGGIVGYASGSISNCYNAGAIMSKGAYHCRAGGIAGWVSGTIYGSGNIGKIEANLTTTSAGRCSNYKETGSTSSSNYKSAAGGIAGYSADLINDCFNRGSVTATSQSIALDIWWADNRYTTISDELVRRDGDDDVYLSLYIGIRGNAIAGIDLKRCRIDSKLAWAGGIVGYGEKTCSNCYNTGSVSGGNERSNIHTYGTVMRYYDYTGIWVLWHWDNADYECLMFEVDYYSGWYTSGINGNINVGTSNCYVTNDYISGKNKFISKSVKWYDGFDNKVYNGDIGASREFWGQKYSWDAGFTQSYSGYYSTCYKTYLTLKYNGKTFTCNPLNTGYIQYRNDYSTWVENSIKNLSFSNWSKTSGINGDYPYPNGLFW